MSDLVSVEYEKEAFAWGSIARVKGATLADNPFKDGSVHEKAWRAGWVEASDALDCIGCICPPDCDCQDPDNGMMSNHCPVHTSRPIPYPNCHSNHHRNGGLL